LAHAAGHLDGTALALVALVDVRPPVVPPSTEPDTRGTVVIVAVFGVLVGLGWLVFFFGLFLPRATP
jgi:hypothetical protein